MKSLMEPSRPLEVPSREPIVLVIKLTTAAAAIVTAMAPSCAFAGGGAISPSAISIARTTAIVDLPRPIKHDETSLLQNSMADSPRSRSCAHGFDRAGQLLRQFRNIGQAHRKSRRELFVNLKEWQAAVGLKEPGAVHPFPFERSADPVLNRCRHDIDGLRRFRLFAQHEKRLSLPPLSRRAEAAYFVEGSLVQVQVRRERFQIALLLPNDLGRDV